MISLITYIDLQAGGKQVTKTLSVVRQFQQPNRCFLFTSIGPEPLSFDVSWNTSSLASLKIEFDPTQPAQLKII
jgi:hypothetical protein